MNDWSIKSQHLEATLQKHKLDSDDYKKIKEILGREPNIIELGIFSAMWSEHCSYKSSKIYLRGFPTEASWVLQGPGENAGVIDLGDNLAAVFKIESHNHPSFIEPHAGAATGVGGILRDIFTMGANPIANLNLLRFGDILDSNMRDKHIHLLHGVVEGIGSYGNCMGIPTIGGDTAFEPCYNGNILVNAFSLGIAKHDEIFYGKASGEGNPIIYVGSKTGRDGLGGAVMSSDSFDSKAKALRPTVQIGDPFVEKLLLDACLEIFKENLIIGIQDMGAAGLTSSSFEMASRSGSGMVMWLDKVPMRESGMNPYELMLSESQERMLLCAKKGCESRIKEIFSKYELDCEIVGEVRNTGKMELFWHGEKCAELEIDPIVESAPILKRPTKEPSYLKECSQLSLAINNESLRATLGANDIATMNMSESNLIALFSAMLSSLDICDKTWIHEQYDDSIKASTIKGAGMLDSSIVGLYHYNSKKALAMSVKCDSRYCYLNPREGAKIAVAKAGRNVALSGAKPLAITDCLNFGSPLNPEVMWQFKESCEGIKEACATLHTPVVSGNVSLYNQTNEDAIYPTPAIVNVGLLEDGSRAIGSHFVNADSYICVLGVLGDDICLSGSTLQKVIGAKISGVVPSIDLHAELRLWEVLHESIHQGLIVSAKDIGLGGIAITLAKMALVGKKSIRTYTESMCQTLQNELSTQIDSLHIASSFTNKLQLFSESHTQVVCEVRTPAQIQKLQALAQSKGLQLQVIGKTDSQQSNCILIDSIHLEWNAGANLYYKSFQESISRV